MRRAELARSRWPRRLRGARGLWLAALLLPAAAAVPPPQLFDLSWETRGDLLADVVPGSVAAAAALTDADIYHLQIDIADDLGRVRVDQEVLAVNRGVSLVEDLWFHLHPNLLGAELVLGGVWLDGVPLEPELLPPRQRLLRVPLAPALAPGEAVVLRLWFELEIPSGSARNYGILSLGSGILSLAHGYALRAVPETNSGGISLPSVQGDLVHADASFYRVRVLAPADLTVVTSGSERSREGAGERQIITVVAGPVRDFYLSASYGYDHVERRVGDTLVRSFFVPGLASGARSALVAAEAALTLFAESFSEYPYREFDLVPIEFGALGIEFPGIVGLATTLYAADAPPGFMEATTVHEVAHQWFYGLVGNDQINEPWLDESFSQWATLHYFGERYGVQGYRGFRSSLEGRWRRSNAREVPIGRPVGDYPGAAYGAIVYGLGPLVLERLERQLGSDRFAALLRSWVHDHRWELVTGADFRRAAEQTCACDLAAFFARWIGQ